MRKKLYFGHPKGAYNTELEKQILKRIREHPDLLEYDVLNPNQPIYDLRAEGIRYTAPDGSSMEFFRALARSCHAGIFLIFPDGKWGSGIFDEAEEIFYQAYPVWSIGFDGRISCINCLNLSWRLSREETSARNREWREKLKT
ncbi:hypothetical protein HY413_03830 [Candidatus Kaiserbacteria bacterium]|nr:hypothetical protein [Candidatus Kaiserbacteria bacterium]